MKTKFKNILCISDLHCGSPVGLTPPDWQYVKKWKKVQSAIWKAWKNIVKDVGGVDVLIVCGDLIDGRDRKGNGVGQITMSIEEQIEMAVHGISAVNMNKCGKIFIVSGTPYHVSSDFGGDDAESLIAKEIKATFGHHLFIEVNGLILDCKHKVGQGNLPHTKFTGIARSKLFNTLWSGIQPQSDILIRGHAHSFAHCGDEEYLAICLPALCGHGSRYGMQQCEKRVDFGAVQFQVYKDSSYDWKAHIYPIKEQKAIVCKA